MDIRHRGVLLCLLLYLLLGCTDGGDLVIEYVLPDGYAGYFWIAEDAEHGQEVRPVDGRVVLHIPDDGILLLKNDQFLSEWHSQESRYANGEPLPRGRLRTTSNEEHALYSLGTSHDGIDKYLVGPKRVYDEYYKNRGEAMVQLHQMFEERLRDKLNRMGEGAEGGRN